MNRTIWVLTAAVVLGACGGGEEGASDEAATDTLGAAPGAAPAAGDPTDPQIAATAVAANEVDIEAGELARERATDAEVKAFAERMITDHSGVNQQASELVSRLGVTPEENPTSQQLRSEGEAARQRLGQVSGAEFDRAYIDNEVTYHQTVLSALDQTLIPSTENAELRALLEQVRPAVQAHLDHARQIQTRLGGQ